MVSCSGFEIKVERGTKGYKVSGDCGGHLNICFLKNASLPNSNFCGPQYTHSSGSSPIRIRHQVGRQCCRNPVTNGCQEEEAQGCHEGQDWRVEGQEVEGKGQPEKARRVGQEESGEGPEGSGLEEM